jgi:hypothetical protein
MSAVECSERSERIETPGATNECWVSPVSRAADLLLGGGPSFDVIWILQAHQVGGIVPGGKPQLPTVVVVSGVDRPFRQRGVPVIRGSQ